MTAEGFIIVATILLRLAGGAIWEDPSKEIIIPPEGAWPSLNECLAVTPKVAAEVLASLEALPPRSTWPRVPIKDYGLRPHCVSLRELAPTSPGEGI